MEAWDEGEGSQRGDWVEVLEYEWYRRVLLAGGIQTVHFSPPHLHFSSFQMDLSLKSATLS